MKLKYYKPVTPSLRERVSINYKENKIWPGSPLKSLTAISNKTGGRNNIGRTTSFNKSGGHKQTYRLIDFKRNKYDVPATILRLEYDPNRSSYIALIAYEDGHLSYILAPENLKADDIIISSKENQIPIRAGNAMPFNNIPVGTTVHNIELKLGYGGQVSRSAGTYGKLIKKDTSHSLVRLSSGKQLNIPNYCFCTIGIVSNSDRSNINKGKAGRSRWLGIKPSVRGVVMNPVDHPHGGGEGKTSGGRCSVTPWGIPTKGYKTRRKNRKNRTSSN
jgi:large subunit ribosomal protein L2